MNGNGSAKTSSRQGKRTAHQQQRQRRKSVSEQVVDGIHQAEQKVKQALTVAWSELPSWQQDNQYILSGYRPQSNSFKRSFKSLTYLHNETVNVYSHLIPAFGFTILALVLYLVVTPRYETIEKADIYAFACFFAGEAICLGMSATYHLISNHSPLIARFGNKLDYVGIVAAITGSFIPSIYYGFYCHPHLQELYWSMVCLPPHLYYASIFHLSSSNTNRFATLASAALQYQSSTVSALRPGALTAP